MMRILRFYTLFLLVLSLLSCQQDLETSDQIPPVFRLGFEPPADDVEKKITQLNEFARYLEKKLSIPVELYEMSNYAPAIEAMKSNKIELFNLGSFGFVIAEEKAGVEPLAYKGRKDTGEGTYFSYFITVRPDLNSIEDVKRKAHTLKFGFGNPASTSGHLIPRKYLPQLGINPDRDFKEVLHSPDHPQTLMAILAGNLDVAVVESTEYERFIKFGRMKEGEVKILYKSAPIQTGPYVIRPNLPEAFKKKVQQALVDLPKEAPEVWLGISGSSNPNIALLPARSELWDDIRETAKLARQQMFDPK